MHGPQSRERLLELSDIDHRTVAIEYRWSEGRPERVTEIAVEFVQQKVDLIVAYGGAVALRRLQLLSPLFLCLR